MIPDNAVGSLLLFGVPAVSGQVFRKRLIGLITVSFAGGARVYQCLDQPQRIRAFGAGRGQLFKRVHVSPPLAGRALQNPSVFSAASAPPIPSG